MSPLFERIFDGLLEVYDGERLMEDERGAIHKCCTPNEFAPLNAA